MSKINLSSCCPVCKARQGKTGLRRHHKHEGSLNKGNFLEILASEVFSKTHARFSSKCKVCVKIPLLHAAAKVIIKGITDEIEGSIFSIVADETIDVSRIEQLSLCF